MKSTVYHINFSTGQLEPVTAAGLLPVGAVITGIKDTGETAGHWHELIRTTYTAPAATTAATAPEAATVGGSLDITVRHNAAKNGIEISFAAKPAPAVLADLKANGWRWSRFSSCWYHTATATAAQFAAKLANLAADEARNLISKTERAGIDHFDMQVEDNMAAACGL